MADIRNMQDVPFAMVERDIAQNDSLSLKAKGLYAVMVSYPKDWVFNMNHLASVSTDGMHATRSAFNELMELDLVRQRNVRGDDGRWLGFEYVVTGSQFSERGKSEAGKSEAGKSQPTNIEVTNKEVTNKQKKDHSSQEKVTKARDVYNQNRGRLPEALPSKSRDRKLLDLIKERGETQALEILQVATKFVARDDFWIEKKYGLTNLLRHIDAKFEAARSEAPTQTKPASTFTSLAEQLIEDEDV